MELCVGEFVYHVLVALILLVLVLIATECLLLTLMAPEPTLKNVPGPSGYPVVGLLFRLLPLTQLHQAFDRVHRKYGRRFQVRLLGRKMVVLRSASVVEQAFDSAVLVGRKQPFLHTYVFEGKALAFSDYVATVPQLRAAIQ